MLTATRRTVLLEEATKAIEMGIPFSIVKHGDGEELCMAGAEGTNCDGHPYSPELAACLKEAFAFLGTRFGVRILAWDDQDIYQSLLHIEGVDMAPTVRFWNTLRGSPRKKIFVGPERLAAAARFLGARHIVIPELNAFSRYREVRAQLLEATNCGNLFLGTICIFCAGMPAKIWIADVLKERVGITCIDAGSALDPLFVGRSRTGQLDKNTAWGLYGRDPGLTAF